MTTAALAGGNWGGEKAAKIRRKRRASASHGSIDLDVVASPTDDQAKSCAVIVCANVTDAASARTALEMLGILRQVRGEPDPDRYLAHCFADLRRTRHADGTVAERA